MSRTRRKPSPSESRLQPGGFTAAQQLIDPAIGLALLLAIFVVYGQVSHFEFIQYDDPAYVFDNPHVQAGLTVETFKWAFTSVVLGNWSPVTMLSHVLTYQFFGLSSGMHHLINVVFHLLASLLLFAAMVRATHARAPSAFVAFVFALHPLHVESVAWVAERKDVLSAFFWFLALYAYVRYVEEPRVSRYLLVALALCLGLMSKTMLVTFPFTLLLFDLWPLERARFPRIPWKLIREKLPLLALCACFSGVAYFAQSAGGAISNVPLTMRLENAAVSYITYLAQMFWPARLAWFYVYPASIQAWEAVGSVSLLVVLSGVAVLLWRTRPYIATGWFWYLGTLVPVIGLVQIGAQSHADRYTYIPITGLSMILAWGAADLAGQWPRLKPALAIAAVMSGLACMALASTQTSYWQDSPTLYRHGVEVTEPNYWSKYNLALVQYNDGVNLMNGGHPAEAIARFEEVVRVKPDWPQAHNNLGILLANVPGKSAEAMGHFESAVRLDPNLLQAQRNLGMMLAEIPGRASEAIAHLEAATRSQPDPAIQKIVDRLRTQHK